MFVRACKALPEVALYTHTIVSMLFGPFGFFLVNRLNSKSRDKLAK